MNFILPQKKLDYWDVFVPGGNPSHTYNPRESLKLERRISEVKRNLCKLVVVTGHTKSGKTVLVKKVLPPEEAIWIDGGMVRNEDEFWQNVIEQLELFQTEQVGKTESEASDLEVKVGVGGSAVLAKVISEVTSKISTAEAESSIGTRTLTSKIVASKALKLSKRPIVIDDFHYLPRELQGSLTRSLKPLIFDGVPVVIIAIPHRRYDAIKVEREMTGRISPVDIPLWEEGELIFIPNEGFRLIRVPFNNQVLGRLIEDAMGSPHLMQEFCRSIAEKYEDSQGSSSDIFPEDALESIYKRIALTIGRPIFEKLARGPQRANRIRRTLQDGSQVDIYELVLHGLAHIRPALVTIEYDELRAAIKEVCVQEVPQLHEISRVLKHMSEIAATDQSSTPVIDFDDSEKKLHVTDPFFAFYLRWGDLKR